MHIYKKTEKLNRVLRVIFWPFINTFFIGFFLWLIYKIGGNVDWNNVLISTPNQFCEIDQGGAIRQPINTFTNLFYIFIGFIILQLGIFDLHDPKPHNFLVRFPLFSIVLGCCAVYVGVGSCFYHASLTELSKRIDGSGVMACFILPLWYSWFRLWGHVNMKKSAQFILRTYQGVILAFLTLNILLFAFKAPHREISTIIVPLTILTLLYTNLKYKLKFKYKYLWLSIASIITAKAMWLIDIHHLYCNNDWIQFHAFWHIMSAVALIFIYLFFRSEVRPTTQEPPQ